MGWTADGNGIYIYSPTPTGSAGAKINGNFAAVSSLISGLSTSKAPLASPAFTGAPTAPTASGGTNTTQLATTAFVQTAVGSYVPTTRTLSTTAPLTGGGDLSANRTIAISSADGSNRGTQSAAHYTLLANATDAAVNNAIVQRGASGEASFGSLTTGSISIGASPIDLSSGYAALNGAFLTGVGGSGVWDDGGINTNGSDVIGVNTLAATDVTASGVVTFDSLVHAGGSANGEIFGHYGTVTFRGGTVAMNDGSGSGGASLSMDGGDLFLGATTRIRQSATKIITVDDGAGGSLTNVLVSGNVWARDSGADNATIQVVGGANPIIQATNYANSITKELGLQAYGNNVLVGSRTSTSTASPLRFSLGGQYATTQTALKFLMYDDGLGGEYGGGISASSMNWCVPSTAKHSFLVNGTDSFRVNAYGAFVRVMTVGTLPTPGTAGRFNFAGDARKPGQGAGAGTGRLVEDDGTGWFTGDGLAAVA